MRVGDAVAVRNGARVGVDEGVSVVVAVGVDEVVGVRVCVRVGVWDNAAIASCACNVRAARVASAPRSCVGDGMAVRVTVGVAVGGTVRVGDGVNVDVDSRVAVTEPGSGVVGFEASV